MTTPNFYDPFHEFYDAFSVRSEDVIVPPWFNIYEPDNQDDYACISVITPNPAAGASKWANNGHWITIGIYRDEGRDTAQAPVVSDLAWSRVGTKLIVTTPSTHHLHVDDVISVYNVNVASLLRVKVKEVISPTQFSVVTFARGGTSGMAGAYQEEFLTDFYNTRVVFRMLPSFKLVPVSVINSLFAASAPNEFASRRTFYNITTDTTVMTPRNTSKSVNYELPVRSTGSGDIAKLARRFEQVYDEQAMPLPVKYLVNGQVAPLQNVDSKFKNEQRFYLQAMKNPADYNQQNNPRLYVYDFYGLDLNDPSRGPFNSDANVIADQADSRDIVGLKVRMNGSELIYTKKIHDEFGNLVLGVQRDTNTLLVRKQILPLKLDKFNRPVKRPE